MEGRWIWEGGDAVWMGGGRREKQEGQGEKWHREGAVRSIIRNNFTHQHSAHLHFYNKSEQRRRRTPVQVSEPLINHKTVKVVQTKQDGSFM